MQTPEENLSTLQSSIKCQCDTSDNVRGSHWPVRQNDKVSTKHRYSASPEKVHEVTQASCAASRNTVRVEKIIPVGEKHQNFKRKGTPTFKYTPTTRKYTTKNQRTPPNYRTTLQSRREGKAECNSYSQRRSKIYILKKNSPIQHPRSRTREAIAIFPETLYRIFDAIAKSLRLHLSNAWRHEHSHYPFPRDTS